MNDIEAGVGTFAAHCEGYGMGRQPKFQVGDRVKQSAKWEASGLNPKTFTGTVAEVYGEASLYPYRVTVDGPTLFWLFDEHELELAE